jgi:hypothetical protein
MSMIKATTGVSNFIFQINRILGMFESPQYTSTTSEFAPVFIVGLPRSGTTFLYQMMADKFEVGYINNLYNYLYGLPLQLTRFRHANAVNSHAEYKSSYGHVSGFLSPSEHFGLWRRLYGENVRAGTIADNETLSRLEIERLRKVIYAIQNRTAHSYLFKCLYLNLCVSSLADVFDTCRFIHIERQFDAILSSMLKAREVNSAGVNRWWSVRVPGWESMKGKPLTVQVEYQLTQLESLLDDQLSRIPSARCFRLNYKALCAEPDKTLGDLGSWLNEVGITRRD